MTYGGHATGPLMRTHIAGREDFNIEDLHV